MTGPRLRTVPPHRTRARLLVPLLAAIVLSPSACTEQPTAPPSSGTAPLANAARLHPYLPVKSGRTASATKVTQGNTQRLMSLGVVAGDGPKVLLLSDIDGESTSGLEGALTAAGFQVTLRPAPEYTWDGTNPSPSGFDAVVHLDGTTFGDFQALSPATQVGLTNFVRSGGGFIGAQWLAYEVAIGTQADMLDLVLTEYDGSQACGECQITYNAEPGQENHPLLTGIPSSFEFPADGHGAGPQRHFDTSPSTVLMRVPSGAPAVLVRQLGAGKVVNFSLVPNYVMGGDGLTLRDPNIQQLYVNAVRWAARTPVKDPATIILVDPVPTFDGTVKGASIVTNPVGLTGLTVTYSQAGVPVDAPVNAGVYQVLVTLDHPDFEAPQATGTLTIRQATPVIHWTPAPTITAGTPLGATQLNASAVGVGGIGLLGEFVYLPAEGTVLEAGTRPLSLEFLPNNGNYTSAIKTVTITVSPAVSGLSFKGFYPPVRNLPVRNRVKAGRAIPVKFAISGRRGLDALRAGSPISRNVPCVAGVPERTVEHTLEARRSRLDFDRRRGQYRYVWKTSPSWAGTCRVLEVTLVDGTTHEALFHFPKKQRSRDDDRHSRDDDGDDRDDDGDRGGSRERDMDD